MQELDGLAIEEMAANESLQARWNIAASCGEIDDRDGACDQPIAGAVGEGGAEETHRGEQIRRLCGVAGRRGTRPRWKEILLRIDADLLAKLRHRGVDLRAVAAARRGDKSAALVGPRIAGLLLQCTEVARCLGVPGGIVASRQVGPPCGGGAVDQEQSLPCEREIEDSFLQTWIESVRPFGVVQRGEQVGGIMRRGEACEARGGQIAEKARIIGFQGSGMPKAGDGVGGFATQQVEEPEIAERRRRGTMRRGILDRFSKSFEYVWVGCSRGHRDRWRGCLGKAVKSPFSQTYGAKGRNQAGKSSGAPWRA